jgi:hypothetical protein
MPGYLLIENKYLSPPRSVGKGIKANINRLGFLDFIRDIDNQDFPFHEESNLCLVGLEDVLLFGKPDVENTARWIHQKLQRAARNLERFNCPVVQIIFRHELVRGDTLRVAHPNRELPLHLIFGSPPPEQEPDGIVYYRCSFNLSGFH